MMSAVGGDAQKPTDWMDEVASSAVLEAAFEWLCKRRVDYSDSADVWNVRFRSAEIKLQLQHDLLGGQYHFSPIFYDSRTWQAVRHPHLHRRGRLPPTHEVRKMS